MSLPSTWICTFCEDPISAPTDLCTKCRRVPSPIKETEDQDFDDLDLEGQIAQLTQQLIDARKQINELETKLARLESQ